MSNIKKYVPIVADKPRSLRYTTNAIVQLEEYFGKSITALDLKELSFKDLRAMIWAGLLHEQADITHEMAGQVMDDAESLAYIVEKATEALTVAMSGGKNEKNQEPATANA